MRILIFGNSGAGKSTLARRLSACGLGPSIDLDKFHWTASGYGQPRPAEEARALTARAADAEDWIIEGVYGWLAGLAAERAHVLIWIDLPWEICRRNLIGRGPRRGGTEAHMSALLAWAEAYGSRNTPSSHAGHARLFDHFPRAKTRIRDGAAIDALAQDARTGAGLFADGLRRP